MQAHGTHPRAGKLSPMNRVLMHAAYQRERQNVRDAVLMQAARAISSRMIIGGQVRAYATEAARKRIVRAQRKEMSEQADQAIQAVPRSFQRKKRNYFRDLPDEITFIIMKFARVSIGTYPLESKLVRRPKAFPYFELADGTLLSAAELPAPQWIADNVNIFSLPYWRTRQEFGSAWTQGTNRSKTAIGMRWTQAKKRRSSLLRFDIVEFRQTFHVKFKALVTNSRYSRWLVPLRARLVESTSSPHYMHVYETRKPRGDIVRELHDLLGEICTDELVHITTHTLPDKSTVNVIFIMGWAIERKHIENDVLFQGFSGMLQDSRIAPMYMVPCGGVVYI